MKPNGATPVIRVLLVDDDQRVLRAWEKAFAMRKAFLVVGTHPGAQGLEALLGELKPDQVVIDLNMPGPDPLGAVQVLSREHPDVRFVVHSGESDPLTIQRVFDAGAWGFVDKLAAATDLFDVLHKVADGQVVFPPGQANQPR